MTTVDPGPAATEPVIEGGAGEPPQRRDDDRIPAEVLRRLRRDRLAGFLYPVASILLILVGWWVVIAVFKVEKYVLPPPGEVWDELSAKFQDGTLLTHTKSTMLSVLLGYGTAVVVGIVLGVVMAAWKTVYRFLYPPIVAAQGLPKSALAPLFLIWFGVGITSKVVIAMTIAFFPIVISTLHGLRSVPPDLTKLGESLGLTRRKMFVTIQFPYALPEVFTGLKVGIALAIVGAVVAEFVAANAGLGYMLLVATSQLNTALVFAALFVLALMGVVLFTLVDVLERLLIPWHISAGRGHSDVMSD